MSDRLRKKVALVTGAASGIGRAVALRFLAEGASVLAADINEAAINRLVAEQQGPIMGLGMDVSSEADWIRCVDAAIDTFGHLDIVANMAGMGIGGSIENFEMSAWDKMVAVNLTGAMLCCKYAVKGIMRSGGSGAIVLMSSTAGLAPAGDTPGYAAVKGGVTTLARSVALHCGSHGYPIRCLSIHPTYVDTPMMDPIAQAMGVDRSEIIAMMAKQVPVGRIATADDIANAVLFAASDEAAMLSGSGIILDGAQLAGPLRSPFDP